MAASQFETLEPPATDATDVATIPASDDPADLLAAAECALATLHPGTAVAPLLGDGAVDRVITRVELEEHLQRIAGMSVGAASCSSPLDHTRLHSRSGEIAGVSTRHDGRQAATPFRADGSPI